MWTSQVYGHHDKMARTKHTEHHKTRSKQRRNRHREITIFCVFRFFWFLLSIFNYLKDFSRKCWITALVRSMKNIGGLNQFSAAANLTHSQHFLEKKKIKNIVHSFSRCIFKKNEMRLFVSIRESSCLSISEWRKTHPRLLLRTYLMAIHTYWWQCAQKVVFTLGVEVCVVFATSLIIRFAPLCLNSGIYTLNNEIGLCCKICKRSDVTLEFNWI